INDITVASPVHIDGSLIGWFASCCHSADIGGRLLSAEARQVYEEGLRLPIVRLAREGRIDPVIEEIIRANVRTPDETMGDIHAQIAANVVASAGLVRELGDLGLDRLDGVAADILDRSERAVRSAILEIPDGTGEAETFADGFVDEELALRCRVEVDGDEIEIDFAGSSTESRHGINVVFNYTHAYASFAVKAAIAPDVPHNAGAFRPVRVSAPEGSILNCRPPAPVAARHIVGHFLPGLIYEALRPLMPDRLLTYGAEALWLTVWTGRTGTDEPFVFNTFQAGGMGARATADGLTTTGFPTGVRAAPTEVIEASTPLVQGRRELITDSGGPGLHRGGLGQHTTMWCRSGRPWTVNANIDRLVHPARGAEGGAAGARGAFFRVGGRQLPSKEHVPLDADWEVALDLPGGGGWGDPRERAAETVLADVVDGYVSMQAARDVYGVAVEYVGDANALVRLPEHYRIDTTAT
ncbi:MAG: hydantoinase B/oxoprolinase family protein, partial [Acidimicrobiia bacterium]|nr:hydantoinase B/oxoprolinase family protein [Acidimicrobiia bacterium]